LLTIKLKRLNYPVEIKRWTKEGEESTTTAVFAAETSLITSFTIKHIMTILDIKRDRPSMTNSSRFFPKKNALVCAPSLKAYKFVHPH
jgi:hypothetical protein